MLRNTRGKYLKKKKQELTQLIGLKFEVHDELVVAKVNVAKYLEYLLSRPAIQISEIVPKDKILVYQFTDMAPWLKWSRYFTGITTTCLKVGECHNLSRLTITAGVYLGPDDYASVKKCFGGVYEEYRKLNKIQIPQCENPTQVFYRSCSDGKQRRVDTGNSSSRSTYPIPDAPEHSTLLGNMMVISTGPVWTVEDTKKSRSKIKIKTRLPDQTLPEKRQSYLL